MLQTGTIAAQASAVGAIVYTPGTSTQMAVSTGLTSALGGTFYTIEFDTVPVGPYRMHLVNASGNHLLSVDVVFTADSWSVSGDAPSLADLEEEFGPGPWGLGTGPSSVTVSVEIAGGGPYTGAIVLIQSGGETVVWGPANGAGTIIFKLPNGSYTATVQSTLGYAPHTPEVFVVNGAAVEVDLVVNTQPITPPSPPGTRSGYWVCIDAAGAASPGEVVNRQFLEPPVNGTGVLFDKNIHQVTSNGAGVASFTGLIPGALYAFWVGEGPVWQIRIPSGTTEIALQDITGVFNA